MKILFPRICQISIKFSIEKKKSESYQIWLIELEEKFEALFPCSSFKAFGSSSNGPRDQWLAALASNYELLPRERDGGPEQRETKERRVADLRTFARYTIKFTIESNAIGRYNVVGLARYINCRPSGSLVDN